MRVDSTRLDYVLEALKAVPSSDRVRALRNLQRIDATVRDEVKAFAGQLPEPDRTEALAELDSDG